MRVAASARWWVTRYRLTEDGADNGVLLDNTARATALIGAAFTAYNDYRSGKSAGCTVGDLLGGAAAGAIGSQGGTAVCFGEGAH